MNDEGSKQKFWAGNAVLAIAMGVLLFMERLSEALGFGAVVLWMGLAALGVWLLMSSRHEPPPGE